jgi:hypothetical protein
VFVRWSGRGVYFERGEGADIVLKVKQKNSFDHLIS